MELALSVEQMKHLKELGVDTSKASATVYTISETENYCGYSRDIVVIDGYIDSYIDKRKAFTLDDILDLFPKEILNDNRRCLLDIFYNTNDNKWVVSYEDFDFSIISFRHKILIGAAYEMLCWVAENNYLNTNSNYEQE